ncbi:MAG: hypothetical protein K2Y16_14190 [Burkholderiales bacterium]|nr:hypothetical protein [Burkholderiales bacterium]MBY0576480.1 hypothetical protein [Gallionellaceae bacterium]
MVFFDGANDSYISIYNNDPEGWILGKNKQILFDKGPFVTSLVKLHTTFGRYSKFVDFFLSPYDYRFQPAHLKKQIQVAALATEMRARYMHNMLDARDYSVNAGAKFFLFLQPTIFSGQNTSVYEYQLRHNPYLVSVGIEKALTEGYQELRSAIKELHSKHAVSALDISKLFDKRPSGDEYFLDWVHVSEKGNAVIANAIFAAIKSSLQR